MKHSHLILASALALSPNAWAELEIIREGIAMPPAQRPEPRAPGSVWKALKNGEPYVVTTVEGTGESERLEDSEGCTWTRPKSFYAPSTSWENCGGNAGEATVSLNGEIFPLQVGGKWSWDVDAGRWRTERSCEVEGTARVKTASGEHETFRIVCVDRWNTRTRYYSPDLGTSVHLHVHRRAKAEHVRYEFLAFE